MIHIIIICTIWRDYIAKKNYAAKTHAALVEYNLGAFYLPSIA